MLWGLGVEARAVCRTTIKHIALVLNQTSVGPEELFAGWNGHLAKVNLTSPMEIVW